MAAAETRERWKAPRRRAALARCLPLRHARRNAAKEEGGRHGSSGCEPFCMSSYENIVEEEAALRGNNKHSAFMQR
jgi:hypothetical protein